MQVMNTIDSELRNKTKKQNNSSLENAEAAY